MKKIVLALVMGVLLGASDSYYERGELVELKEIQQPRDGKNNGIRYYKKVSGQKVGITDQILVKCKEGVDCLKLLEGFQQTNVSKLTETIYVVKLNDYDRIFSLSRDLFNSGEVEFAHPNFIKERKLR